MRGVTEAAVVKPEAGAGTPKILRVAAERTLLVLGLWSLVLWERAGRTRRSVRVGEAAKLEVAGELRAATVVRLPDTRCQIFADQSLTQREGACPTRLPLALDSDAGGLLDLRPHHEAPRSHH